MTTPDKEIFNLANEVFRISIETRSKGNDIDDVIEDIVLELVKYRDAEIQKYIKEIDPNGGTE